MQTGGWTPASSYDEEGGRAFQEIVSDRNFALYPVSSWDWLVGAQTRCLQDWNWSRPESALTQESMEAAVTSLLATGSEPDALTSLDFAPYLQDPLSPSDAALYGNAMPGFPQTSPLFTHGSPILTHSPIMTHASPQLGFANETPETASSAQAYQQAPSVRAIQSGEDSQGYPDSLYSPAAVPTGPAGGVVTVHKQPPKQRAAAKMMAGRRQQRLREGGVVFTTRAADADRVAGQIETELDDKLFSLKNRIYKEQIQAMIDDSVEGALVKGSISVLQRPLLCTLNSAERALCKKIPNAFKLDLRSQPLKQHAVLNDLLTSLVNKVCHSSSGDDAPFALLGAFPANGRVPKLVSPASSEDTDRDASGGSCLARRVSGECSGLYYGVRRRSES